MSPNRMNLNPLEEIYMDVPVDNVLYEVQGVVLRGDRETGRDAEVEIERVFVKDSEQDVIHHLSDSVYDKIYDYVWEETGSKLFNTW